MNEKEIIKNLERCPSFERCNKNLCPLDLKLELRVGDNWDKCRYMIEKKTRIRKYKNKLLTESTAIMPDNLLNFVPERNIKKLNNVSRQRWEELKAQNNFKVL